MAETYDEIVENLQENNEMADNYCDRYHCDNLNKLQQTTFTDAALHLAARVRDAVGGDPSEWFVLDADGNRVHIGDMVISANRSITVVGLGKSEQRKTVIYQANYDYADTVHKVIPDTREEIVGDTFERIKSANRTLSTSITDYMKIIGDAVDRAMKLGAEHK